MAPGQGVKMPYGALKLRIVSSIDKKIAEMRRCEVMCPMTKTLDQQLDEIRILASKVKLKYDIELPEYLDNAFENIDNFNQEEVNGLELIRELLEKFIRLDSYIDSLR